MLVCKQSILVEYQLVTLDILFAFNLSFFEYFLTMSWSMKTELRSSFSGISKILVSNFSCIEAAVFLFLSMKISKIFSPNITTIA